MRTPAPIVVTPLPVMVIWVKLEMVDVDERGGMLDVVLHQVDEVGAAAEKLRSAWVGDGVDGLIGVGGALVV